MGFIDLVFGDRSEKRRALLDRARRFFRQGRVEKALEHAERAIKLDPDGAESRETLGRIYFRMGMLAWADGGATDAIECFSDAVRLLNDPLVLFYRGLVYRDTRQHLRAIEDFSRILRSEEMHVVALATYATFCRGLCYREKGEHKFAAKDFTTCLLADPGSPLKHRFLAHRALCRAALGELPEAYEDIGAANAIAPRSAEVAQLRAALATISPQAARPALPPARTVAPQLAPGAAAHETYADHDYGDELLVTERDLPAATEASAGESAGSSSMDWDEESTGRRLMPELEAHVASRTRDDEPDPSESDWTLIPDSSPTIPRPEAQRGTAARSSPSVHSAPSVHTDDNLRLDDQVQKKQGPHNDHWVTTVRSPDEPTSASMPDVSVEPRTEPSMPAFGRGAAREQRPAAAQTEGRAQPQGTASRLEALKRKREQAFAERDVLFGKADVSRAVARDAAPAVARTSGATTTTVTSDAQPPAVRAPKTSESRETKAAETPLSEKARRCLRKLDEMLTRLEAEPVLFEDVDYCVDYLLVVARLRELPRGEKKAIVRFLGADALHRYEQTESRARDQLATAPIAQAPNDLATDVSALLDAAPPPARVPGSAVESNLRAHIERFQTFSRAQKYLFMSRCGEQRFARFIDYFIAMGGAETA